jgi:hypothetical protein
MLENKALMALGDRLAAAQFKHRPILSRPPAFDNIVITGVDKVRAMPESINTDETSRRLVTLTPRPSARK